MKTVMTRDGDMLDQLCKTHLGSEQMVPKVLSLNPGLAALGPVYEAGLMIVLPDAEPVTARPQIRLWGRG